ncbi:MAG: hypothetical protein Q8P84_04080, partial [Deltaproteobacteria bacterium]|nr:hypothetical protein [Deltaproteobacteria bacterium]
MNHKGHVFVLFLFFLVTFAFVTAAIAEFSRIGFYKMKLQGALDRGTYAAASYMTEILNQWSLKNRKAHELFLKVEEELDDQIAQPTDEKAKERVEKLWQDQNDLYDSMEEKGRMLYAAAFEIAQSEAQKEIPNAQLIPLYEAPLVIWDGPRRDFAFDKINGMIFDPTGHKRIPGTNREARIGFVKDPSKTVASVFGAELKIPKWKPVMRAVSAAQPFGGSIWNYAVKSQSDEAFLYQTAFVPVQALPKEGFLKPSRQRRREGEAPWALPVEGATQAPIIDNWRDFEPQNIQHKSQRFRRGRDGVCHSVCRCHSGRFLFSFSMGSR